MNVSFEVLDRESGMLLKAYESQDQALDDLLAIARDEGFSHLLGLALLRVTDEAPSLVAMDDSLVAIVQQFGLVKRSSPNAA